MFKRITIQFSEPICLCLEENLGWTVSQSQVGPTLIVWCQGCEVKVLIPNNEFKAGFNFDMPYPGRAASKAPPKTEVMAGDVIDLSEYVKRRRENPPS